WPRGAATAGEPRRRVRPEPAAGSHRRTRARLRGHGTTESADRLLLGDGVRDPGAPPPPARLRSADAGVQRPDVDQRSPRPGAGAGSEARFARLTSALGTPGLADDPRFKDNPSRVSNRAALVEAISALTRQRKSAELVEALRVAGVPASPILTVDQMLAEPQTRESGVLVRAQHPRLPEYRSIGLPLTWDGVRPAVRRVPPLLGEHSGDVLTWLGYTLDDVRSLKGKGVIQ